jgi:hypothetical protein
LATTSTTCIEPRVSRSWPCGTPAAGRLRDEFTAKARV